MAVRLEGIKPPRSGHIQVHISADINITARTARQRVSRLVASELGNLLFGGAPTLVVDECIVWRVPVMLAYPDTGPIGQAGTLDIDVGTGQVLVTPEQLAEIKVEAHTLAQRAVVRPV